MRAKNISRWLVRIAVITTLLLALPAPALADGGPVLSDPQLWAQIEEGQQVAVIKLGHDNTAHVDLFISMLDRTGESHEIVFFLPLGMNAANFHVAEKTTLEFDDALTEELDQILLREAKRTLSFKRNVRWALLLGTAFINGAWSWPFWFLWSLAGCAPATTVAPIATYETESSQVAIYGMEEETDLQALIETTGLDPAVRETLDRLEGQQIAVVTLQTQPPPEEGISPGRPTGQPGIHLAWTTTLVSHSAEATSRLREGGTTYAYPLGTGSAWAHPIEMTRVYVVAPPGVDFTVEYPRLGRNRSGFTLGGWFGRSEPRILDADGPAYALENAVGDFGRVWRATYTYSNSSEDVRITRLPEISEETLSTLKGAEDLERVQALTWVVSFVVALVLWLITWRYAMPRLLGIEYEWRELTLYRHALGWALLYPLTNGVLLALTIVLAPLAAGVAILLGAPLLFITLLGVVSIFFFVRWGSRTLGVSQGRAFLAYTVVVLLTNFLYMVFALGYTALLGAG
jgi:hypothetical protein